MKLIYVLVGLSIFNITFALVQMNKPDYSFYEPEYELGVMKTEGDYAILTIAKRTKEYKKANVESSKIFVNNETSKIQTKE